MSARGHHEQERGDLRRRAMPLILTVSLAAAGALLGATALAESNPRLTAETWAEGSLLSTTLESPVVMLILAVCAGVESFLLWGIIQTLSGTRLGSTSEIIKLEQLLDEKRYSDALAFCEARRRYYTRLVAAALGAMHGGRDAITLAVGAEQEGEERTGMDRIHDLGSLAGVILLVGLLGLCVNAVEAMTALADDRGRFLLLARAAFVPPAFACTLALPATLMEAAYRRKLPQIHARVRHESGRIIARIEV